MCPPNHESPSGGPWTSLRNKKSGEWLQQLRSKKRSYTAEFFLKIARMVLSSLPPRVLGGRRRLGFQTTNDILTRRLL